MSKNQVINQLKDIRKRAKGALKNKYLPDEEKALIYKDIEALEQAIIFLNSHQLVEVIEYHNFATIDDVLNLDFPNSEGD